MEHFSSVRFSHLRCNWEYFLFVYLYFVPPRNEVEVEIQWTFINICFQKFSLCLSFVVVFSLSRSLTLKSPSLSLSLSLSFFLIPSLSRSRSRSLFVRVYVNVRTRKRKKVKERNSSIVWERGEFFFSPPLNPDFFSRSLTSLFFSSFPPPLQGEKGEGLYPQN